MRITKEQVLKVLEEKKRTSEPNVPTLLSHQMNVSEDARFIRQLRDEILAMPDVRAELVEEIRARIERGEYKVSAEDIVEAMIRRMIADQAD
ncbi:MAG TPA: flagellar biosynthesis anti-sigma factor FlgM [Fimbriimonadales bacterium]|nr:flagellar biosynthesis anti-sigma factor FlgM [Fimbriimonadales bacterium]